MLFVGHLSDRMLSRSRSRRHGRPRPNAHRFGRGDAAALTRIGLYSDKVDGKAGMKTRAALGAYQKSAGLKVDCWPSEAVLRSIAGRAESRSSLRGAKRRSNPPACSLRDGLLRFARNDDLNAKTRPRFGRV